MGSLNSLPNMQFSGDNPGGIYTRPRQQSLFTPGRENVGGYKKRYFSPTVEEQGMLLAMGKRAEEQSFEGDDAGILPSNKRYSSFMPSLEDQGKNKKLSNFQSFGLVPQ